MANKLTRSDRDEIREIREILREAHERERKLAVLLDKCRVALKIVSVGIWRDKKRNACGLAGEAVAVHAVEDCLRKLDSFVENDDSGHEIVKDDK